MSHRHIECINLTKQYSRNKQTVNAVDDINISIYKNEAVFLRGRSGAGKSTLLNLMCGLIKPSSGKVMIDDNCISEFSNKALSELLSNKIGIIFQSFNLLPTYTVYENIEIALVPRGLNREYYNERIISLLERFNLYDKLQLLPTELSAGQQQKVAIIRTLIKEPSIIFADEPTGSVDEETATEILEHLFHLKNEKKITLIVATHGKIPDKIADRVFIIEAGCIRNIIK